MNYLIIVLIKMRLLIFLALSQHGSAYKHENEMIFQISIYYWMQNFIF